MQGSISPTINYLQLILYKTLNTLPSSPIFSASDEEIWPDLLLSHIGDDVGGGGGGSTVGGYRGSCGGGSSGRGAKMELMEMVIKVVVVKKVNTIDNRAVVFWWWCLVNGEGGGSEVVDEQHEGMKEVAVEEVAELELMEVVIKKVDMAENMIVLVSTSTISLTQVRAETKITCSLA
ncbi:hypothetical protein F2Q69_00002255 [Brassica cretica]|uniref:Uncharacterized protein n=1 Tax=Brassica cretica TaxID=69181 RepID=A0A8S9PE90_BRACR|nr:hypothetical protein F2Q69_00002255 [Brassica cretica]